MSTKTGIIVSVFLLAGTLLFFGMALMRDKSDFTLPNPVMPAISSEESTDGKNSSNRVPVELVGKNLFHPLRGAVSIEKKDLPASVSRRATAENFILTGIFSFGEERGAVIASDSRKTAPKNGVSLQRIFRTGTEVGAGYILSDIRTDEVILTRGDGKLTLRFQNVRKKESSGTKLQKYQSISQEKPRRKPREILQK